MDLVGDQEELALIAEDIINQIEKVSQEEENETP
jgi:hypothetical protein